MKYMMFYSGGEKKNIDFAGCLKKFIKYIC